MSDQIVRDDMSEYGLRRVRVLSGGVIDVKAWIDRTIPGDAKESTYLAWEDQLTKMHHLYMCWKEQGMEGKAMRVYSVNGGGVTGAAGQAAVRYHQVYGVWPDTAVVREGMETPEEMQVQQGAEVVTTLKFKKVPWMRANDVGVMIGG